MWCFLRPHLTLHSRMSGSRWVITPLWLSGSWRSFCYSFSMYSCHLFLIYSASVKSILFLYFIVSIFAWNVPLVSLIFLKRSLVFPILLFSSVSLHWLLKKAFLSLLAILWNSAFRWLYLSFSLLPLAFVLFSAICKTSSDNHFAFLHLFFLGMVLITPSYTMSWTSMHNSSGTLLLKSGEITPERMKRQRQKWRKHPVVDVTDDGSKFRCCKEQFCIETWNVRSMNQGKLEVVKQEMARVNINILGISELKWTRMDKFNSDDHYIYYKIWEESLRRNGVAFIVNKRVWNAVLEGNLKNGRMISVHFQGRPILQ